MIMLGDVAGAGGGPAPSSHQSCVCIWPTSKPAPRTTPLRGQNSLCRVAVGRLQEARTHEETRLDLVSSGRFVSSRSASMGIDCGDQTSPSGDALFIAR
jgi:hypothetical protein